eukprot:Amastigsp_a508642_106.p3 type:complete len:153 gc:universal Amastigsp_a508642_106:619-161(-)
MNSIKICRSVPSQNAPQNLTTFSHVVAARSMRTSASVRSIMARSSWSIEMTFIASGWPVALCTTRNTSPYAPCPTCSSMAISGKDVTGASSDMRAISISKKLMRSPMGVTGMGGRSPLGSENDAVRASSAERWSLIRTAGTGFDAALDERSS